MDEIKKLKKLGKKYEDKRFILDKMMSLYKIAKETQQNHYLLDSIKQIMINTNSFIINKYDEIVCVDRAKLFAETQDLSKFKIDLHSDHEIKRLVDKIIEVGSIDEEVNEEDWVTCFMTSFEYEDLNMKTIEVDLKNSLFRVLKSENLPKMCNEVEEYMLDFLGENDYAFCLTKTDTLAIMIDPVGKDQGYITIIAAVKH